MSGAETKIDNPDEDGNGEVSDVRQSFSDIKYGTMHKAVNCLVWVSLCYIVLGLGSIIPKIIIILFINKSIVI